MKAIYSLEIEPWNDEAYDSLIIKSELAEHTLQFKRPVRWFKHESELKKLSKQYPEYLFILSMTGDSIETIWVKYFKNEKIQFAPANVTFDEFNEEKLQ